MAFNQGQATPFGSRTAAFGEGSNGGSDVASSLSVTANNIKAGTPHSFTPQSVLHQYQQSGNGMSSQDASRRFIGQNMPAPSFNGTSQNPASQEKYQSLRAMGGLLEKE